MIMFHREKITMKSVTLIFAHFSYTLGQDISIKDKHFAEKRSNWKSSIFLISNDFESTVTMK